MEYSKPQKEKYYNQTGGYTKGGYNTGYKKVNILNKSFYTKFYSLFNYYNSFNYIRTTTKEVITQTTITINLKMITTLNLKFNQSTLPIKSINFK